MGEMHYVRLICNAGLHLRSKARIKVRQTLQKVTVIIPKADFIGNFENIIKDELNVKEVHTRIDVEQYCDYKLEIDVKQLAKRVATKLQQLKLELSKGNWKIDKNGQVNIAQETLLKGEYKLEPFTQHENAFIVKEMGCVVVLDTNLNQELIDEGKIKDIVRHVQECRKLADFYVSDKILLKIDTNNKNISDLINKNKSYIEQNTLSIIINDKITSNFNKN